MKISFTGTAMSKPDDMTIKAELSWNYYRFNDENGWIAARIGDGAIVVTDESGKLDYGFVFPDLDAFVCWLEADAEEQLNDHPAEFLRDSGAINALVLSDGVVKAALATINADDMITVTVFCDTTGLYTEEEMDNDPLCDLRFPRKIVSEWYKKCYLPTVGVDDCPPSLETFLGCYSADDTDTLFDYAVKRGFAPKRKN